MRVEAVVGGRIREGREDLQMTQEDLGTRLALPLGKAWSRQAVSLAESGQRAFTAAELVALAQILGFPSAGWLLTPSLDITELEMPSGHKVPLWQAREWPGGHGVFVRYAMEAAEKVRGAAAQVVDSAQEVKAESDKLEATLESLLATLSSRTEATEAEQAEALASFSKLWGEVRGQRDEET